MWLLMAEKRPSQVIEVNQFPREDTHAQLLTKKRAKIGTFHISGLT